MIKRVHTHNALALPAGLGKPLSAAAAGTAGIVARWRRLGYDASSRVAMASTAERTSARAGESAWRVYAESLIDCGALFARLVPPDDDPGWTHSALYVAPSETARRRRYRLRMSYGEVGHRRVADGAADGVEVKALKLEDEKPRLPFTGKDFGQPGEEDDADANAPAADEAADEAADATAAAAVAPCVRWCKRIMRHGEQGLLVHHHAHFQGDRNRVEREVVQRHCCCCCCCCRVFVVFCCVVFFILSFFF